MRKKILVLSFLGVGISLTGWLASAQWGIVNAANSAISGLQAQIAASTPLPSLTPTPVATAVATAMPTVTPYAGTPTPTPEPATSTAVFWDNGALGSVWGNGLYIYGMAGGTSNAPIADPVDGSTTVLECDAIGSVPDAGVQFAFVNYVASLNLGNYFTAGHIQADLELGPAFVTATTQVQVTYGGWISGSCTSAALTGLSPGAFTHVSIPFATGFAGCNGTGQFVTLFIKAVGTGGGNLSAGAQLYVNNVQITPN